MQKKFMINGVEIWQPDKDMKWNPETTHTPDSGETQDGIAHVTPMFIKDRLTYQGSNLPIEEARKILQMIMGKNYDLYAFHPYYMEWLTMRCYSGVADVSIGSLKEGEEIISSLSFNAVRIYPLEMKK